VGKKNFGQFSHKPGAGISGQGAARDGNCWFRAVRRLIHQLDRLQRYFEALDGYGLEAQIEDIARMGFEPADGDRLVSAFSGGWQMRMSLGKILLQNLIYCCWTSQ